MIVASGIELRAGARLLLADASFQVAEGDRIGLVGRNGAGQDHPRQGAVRGRPARRGQRPAHRQRRLPAAGPAHRGPGHLALDRILSARGLDEVLTGCARPRRRCRTPTRRRRSRRSAATARSADRLAVLGGYAAESEAAAIAASLGPARPGAAASRCARSPAGSAAGSSWPGSCSPTRRRCCSTSRPTTWTPTRSPGCATTCKNYRGGLIVISHDVDLLEQVVNKVFHLDANRSVLDVYNVGWKAYLQQRETDERRRKRERANAERQASALQLQADKMRRQGDQGQGRAEHGSAAPTGCSPGVEAERPADRVARLRFPEPASCGKTPLTAAGLSKSYGSLEVFTDVDLADRPGQPGGRPRPQRRGQDHPAAAAGRAWRSPDTGKVMPGHGLQARLLRPGARDARHRADRCWRTCAPPRRS